MTKIGKVPYLTPEQADEVMVLPLPDEEFGVWCGLGACGDGPGGAILETHGSLTLLEVLEKVNRHMGLYH